MFENYLALIVLISPVFFVITAIASWFQPGAKPEVVKNLSTLSTLVSIIIAAISGFFVWNYKLLETPLLGINGFGLSLRLDPLSTVMLSMIALLGFIIVRFSMNYLDGDNRQGAFIGRLAATIASVQLLVLSGNLGLLFVSWILTSISLHRLLVFYSERPGALLAARKKFILARLGDACLLIAIILLYNQFGTGDMETIFKALTLTQSTGFFVSVELPALFLVFAALLKSAQFPTHGWLIEVMETPTPVSALLHAGLLNAGPFLIIRMAHVVEASTYAPLMLLAIGGLTALFGSIVYLTQTSIKTALGYSSVAHMGFSLLICGLGVYPAAMLHLVAHSFYKAHSFLSSGSIIDAVRVSNAVQPKRLGNPFRISAGILLALVVYGCFAFIWGIDPVNELPLFAIGAIIVMGLSRLFTSALDLKAGLILAFRVSLLAMMVAALFFTLEAGAHHILSSQLPELSTPILAERVLIYILLLAFGATVAIQILAPMWSSSPRYLALAVHLRNGLYANALFDRMVGALRIPSLEYKSSTTKRAEVIERIKPLEIEQLEEQPV